MSSALARAYASNPDINQQRAAVRSFDENVPKAKAGWLPKVNATASVGAQYTYLRAAPTRIDEQHPVRTRPNGAKYDDATPRSYGVTASETLFDGFRTLNSVRQAESQAFGARETMRNTEQNILLNAATSYMNVLRDTAVVNLRKNNISVLEEQLRQTRDRFQVGEVTRTDVAQAEACARAVALRFLRRAVASARLGRRLPPVCRRRSQEPCARQKRRRHVAEAVEGGGRHFAGRASRDRLGAA